jgi:uncharacterized protein involved in exopolysaccharide biosynthesis
VELRDYFAIISRRRLLIVFTFLLIVGVAFVATLAMPSRYTASALLRLSTPGALTSDAVRADATDYVERLQNTYAKLGASKELRSELKQQLHLDETPEISVRPEVNTELMTLKATTSSAASAVRAANLMALLLVREARQMGDDSAAQVDKSFSDRIGAINARIAREQAARNALGNDPNVSTSVQRTRAELDRQIAEDTTAADQLRASLEQSRIALLQRVASLAVLNQATTPGGRSSPNTKLNLALAAFLGLLVAVALAFIVDNLKRKPVPVAEIKITEDPSEDERPSAWSKAAPRSAESKSAAQS